MNYKNILIALGVVAVTVPLLKLVYDRVQAAQTPTKDLASPKVKNMVAETLKEHAGEESPFVQAFAHAVE